ncbi:MAG TPA: hypothetical protein VL547_14155 [Dinghuibacter sp.]|uniref:hypothetical protein n=1 Tax=Dinghuibacter sp. TaxID=2024697 RepID=UPI002B6D8F2B|nr:hypothetical protein [Dinghuibacter sp.]HTJ13173.1 hypothetical protein [Dinghuibacter sp.]
MNAELLYEALNDRHSLEQLTENDLGRLVSSHPYFSIGQLLLAKKQRQNNDKESYQHQRERLHAFYRNPWWLYYQLELADNYATPAYVTTGMVKGETPFESIARQAVQARAVKPAEGPRPEVPQPVEPPTRTPVEPTKEPSLPEAPEPEEPVKEPSTPELPQPDAPKPTEIPQPGGPEVEPPAEPTIPGAPGPEMPDVPGPEVPPPFEPPIPSPSGPEMGRHAFVPWPGMEEEDLEIPTLMGASELHEVAAEAHEAPRDHAMIAEPYLPYMVTSAVAVPEPREEEEEEQGDPDDTDAPEGEPVVHHLDMPEPPPAFPTAEPAPFPFSVTPLAHDFTFEPLHTVDYFASQGIKLELEENPTDTLTRHLKSFTEWLKTMKRISPMDGGHTDLDAATEAEIQQLASTANRQREAVVTESMAHVWVLQGKLHKAVEVYNKLSLQHPEKRAYFAAKIEQLNKL